MASMTRKPDGRVVIQFVDSAKRRRTLSLGRVGDRQARRIADKIEQLNACRRAGLQVDGELTNWLANLPTTMLDKLSNVELIPPREDTEKPKAATLRRFIEEYEASRTDVKPKTKEQFQQARDNLIEFFGHDKPLEEITVAAAKRYKIWLSTEKKVTRTKKRLSPNTVARRIGLAKQFFASAVDDRLITENPFNKKSVGSTTVGPTSNFHFVSLEDAQAVLAACPDADWRLLFALGRFGGVRSPSEPSRMRWVDIHWDQNRMTIWSPKTACHEGHESRICPIFAELRPFLQDAFEQAEPGAEYVLERCLKHDLDLRWEMTKIVRKAGLKPWPRLFHNLRATRQTELVDFYPAHCVSKWLGNSIEIAERHYLKETAAHVERAATEGAAYALHSGAGLSGMERKDESGGEGDTLENREKPQERATRVELATFSLGS
jgi:integrase